MQHHLALTFLSKTIKPIRNFPLSIINHHISGSSEHLPFLTKEAHHCAGLQATHISLHPCFRLICKCPTFLDKSTANGFPSFFPPPVTIRVLSVWPLSQSSYSSLLLSSPHQFIYTIRHINDISRAAFGCNLHRHKHPAFH